MPLDNPFELGIPSNTSQMSLSNRLPLSGDCLGPGLIGAVHLQQPCPGHVALVNGHLGQVPDLVQNPEAVAAMLTEGPGSKAGYASLGSAFSPYYHDAEVLQKLQSHRAWDMQVSSFVVIHASATNTAVTSGA